MSETQRIPTIKEINKAESNYSLYLRVLQVALIITGIFTGMTISQINSEGISSLLAIDAFIGLLDITALNLFLSSKNDLDDINQIGRDLMKKSTRK